MARELKKIMIEEMELRNLDDKTKTCYLRSVADFADYFNKAPDKLGVAEMKIYQLYLMKEKRLAPNSVNRHFSGIRFFYRHVVNHPEYAEQVPRVKARRKLPNVLTVSEVGSMIKAVDNLLWKAVLMLTYSAGLRQGEVRALKITDIDSKKMSLHIKGKKGCERKALLTPLALEYLRTYWKNYRLNHPKKSDFLFLPTKNSYNSKIHKQLSHTAVGYMVSQAAKLAGIKKKFTLIY